MLNELLRSRADEVLLNYAGAKAELNQMTIQVWDETVGLLRSRGTANAAPQAADPYLQQVYFPEISDAWLLEVRRERGVELVYEGLRYADLISNTDIVLNPILTQNPGWD